MIDLVVLVADRDAEFAVKTLIARRYQSLGIRPVEFKIIQHPQHDPGTFLDAHNLLRQYVGKARHALVILDREGSGQEGNMNADEIESAIENRLSQNGWARDSVTAIALDPELEVWVWSRSPHVQSILNITNIQAEQVFQRFPPDGRGKPNRPKEAMRFALRLGNKPPSASLFQELAERVSLNASERAFDRFKSTLAKWFPLT